MEVTPRNGWDRQLVAPKSTGLPAPGPKLYKNSLASITNQFCRSFPRCLGKQEGKYCVCKNMQDISGVGEKKLFLLFFIQFQAAAQWRRSAASRPSPLRVPLHLPLLFPILRLIKEHAWILSPEVCIVSLHVGFSFVFCCCLSFFFFFFLEKKSGGKIKRFL